MSFLMLEENKMPNVSILWNSSLSSINKVALVLKKIGNVILGMLEKKMVRV